MKPDLSMPLCLLPTYDLRPLICGDGFGELRSEPAATLTESDGSVRIPFRGFVCDGLGTMCGIVSPTDVMRAIDAALAEDPSRRVTIDFDSPGGCTPGIPELSAYIADAVARGADIHAYTRGLCLSAAYWVASRCKSIQATRGAVVGKITQ